MRLRHKRQQWRRHGWVTPVWVRGDFRSVRVSAPGRLTGRPYRLRFSLASIWVFVGLMVGYLVGESVYYSLFPMHDMTFDILGGATLLIMLLAAYFGGLSADIAYDAVAERSLLVRIPVPGLTAGLITFFPPTVFATLFYVPLSFKPWDNFMEFFPLFLSLGGGAFLGGALYAVLRAYKEWSFK